jgi:hypothetical protein
MRRRGVLFRELFPRAAIAQARGASLDQRGEHKPANSASGHDPGHHHEPRQPQQRISQARESRRIP